MRLRRRHSDARSWPAGRAEVELFTFWEDDLTDDRPDPAPDGRTDAHTPAEPWRPGHEPDVGLSTAPLWWAVSLAILFLVVAVLG
jgi:hypothetical protein